MHYFYEAKMDQIAQFFQTAVLEKNKKLLQIPHALTNSGAATNLPWAGITEPEQMMIDLRTDVEREEAYKGKKKATFNTDIDIFEERPELQLHKQTLGQVWYGSVHSIKKSNQIMLTKGSSTAKANMDAEFYSMEQPHQL